jgi:DNA-binding transcriptional MerR regulator
MELRRKIMDLLTISQISKAFNISTRTLRYYEKIGLLTSSKKEDYAYRTYNDEAIKRLKQIIILRKLRIPLKQIEDILRKEDTIYAVEVFQKNIEEIVDEMAALSTIKSILATFIEKLGDSVSRKAKLDLLGDEKLLKVLDALTVTRVNFKEEKSMEELNKANESLTKLQDVRIVYIPPMTVAASHYVGKDCEIHASELLDNFIRDSELLKLKPDARHFGFNNPMPPRDSEYGTPSVGYEMWVSIPEDMEVTAPLVRKQFYGGMYVAHAIRMDEFDHWGLLAEWVFNRNSDYESAWGEKRCDVPDQEMDWALEEQLNFYNNFLDPNFSEEKMQLDLLFPIKRKDI